MLMKPLMIPRECICLRDEFTCPITRELLRDPWLASDGHSYERDAIEQWVLSKGTSPKTGQPLESKALFPNHNLRRLMKDLINEGGEGLYIHDESESGDATDGLPDDFHYRFALVPQQVLVLKCLGPVESDWNTRCFRVSENGCIGGRRRPQNLRNMDFMYFNDATVSRTHFQIEFDREVERRFFIKDCCSAGGTYLRIPYGVPKPLYPGLMVMLGKHQLVVLPPEREEEGIATSTGDSFEAGQEEAAKEYNHPATPTADSNIDETGSVEARRPTALCEANEQHQQSLLDQGCLVEGQPPMLGDSCPISTGGEDDISVPETPLHESDEGHFECAEVDDEEVEANRSILRRTLRKEAIMAQGRDTIQLQCFAPEGTPIQGNTYTVTSTGATLGRKQLNTIAFSHNVKDQVMGIDSSISGEHARVVWSKDEQYLQLYDGTESKPSTNGTWFRLSSMYHSSEPYCLCNGTELLIGTVRFSVTLEQVIVEADAREYMDQQKQV